MPSRFFYISIAFLIPFFCLSQDKGHLFSSLSLFKEVDQLFPSTRKQAPNQYVFNYGLGANIGYGYTINKKLSFNIQGGFWYFFNNKINTDALNREFRYRNIVTPVIGKISWLVFENEKLHLLLAWAEARLTFSK